MKRLTLISLMIMAMLPILTGAGFAFDPNTSRLIPTDSVSIYQDGKVIGKYTREAPLPLGEVLACNGRCAIKSNTMTMVAEDGTVFSIDAGSGSRVITLMKGKIHFGISDLPESIVFVTPQGAISADQIFLNASSGTRMLEGYLAAGTESSEIGVIDGGSMKVRTYEGETLVRPGNRLLLAQADIGTGTGGAGAGAGGAAEGGFLAGMSTGTMASLAAGGIVGVTATGLIINDFTDSDGSPSSP